MTHAGECKRGWKAEKDWAKSNRIMGEKPIMETEFSPLPSFG
jgi:hypothetical protein